MQLGIPTNIKRTGNPKFNPRNMNEMAVKTSIANNPFFSLKSKARTTRKKTGIKMFA